MLLEELAEKGISFENPLDLGCGTGILGMGIARLFNKSVILSDNDPEALIKTLENLAYNGLADQGEVYLSEGFDAPSLKEKGPFDLITANILAGPLIDLAKDMVQVLTPQGTLILSGILETQKENVVAAYEKEGLSLKKSLHLKNWVCLLFQR